MTTMARLEAPFVSTLPGRYYYDPAIYEMELERIFSQMWVCVGRADAIIGAGAYEVVTVGRESIIVVRGRDDVLRAFLNVCRHRGARLCNEASGKLKGSIQCRYHAWTYGLDGRLIGAPNVLSDEQFERALYGLLLAMMWGISRWGRGLRTMCRPTGNWSLRTLWSATTVGRCIQNFAGCCRVIRRVTFLIT